MKPVVIGSLMPSAGKTSLIIGMARVLAGKFAYLKPFGDRLLYRKKRQWDYDSALLSNVFSLAENPELITLGFDHSKLRFMFDADSTREKLIAMADTIGNDHEYFFVEGGRDLSYGASVHLDPITVAKCLDAKLVLVIAGDDASIVDHFAFLEMYLSVDMINFTGVIINKVKDLDEFESDQLPALTGYDIPILGIVPRRDVLSEYPVSLLAEQLFAKVIAGEAHTQRMVRNVYVATTGPNVAQRNPEFTAPGTLVITSGDRTDLILAAVDQNAAGVVLTDDVAPPSNIVAAAEDRGIPLLLVRFTTAHTARQIQDLDPLITREDSAKLDEVERLVREHVKLDFLQ